jgi:hypothetical protein
MDAIKNKTRQAVGVMLPDVEGLEAALCRLGFKSDLAAYIQRGVSTTETLSFTAKRSEFLEMAEIVTNAL